MNILGYLLAKKGKNTSFKDIPSYLIGKNNGGLPSEYQEVEYIENSGTQYINTGITPGKNYKFEIKFMDTTAENSFYATGARASSSGTIYYGINGSSVTGNILVSSTTINSGAYRMKNYIYECSANFNEDKTGTAYLKCLTTDDEFTGTQNAVLPNNYTYKVMLFAVRSANIVNSMRLYYFKQWRNGDLMRDFVPCYRKADNVAGLYDKVTKTFYTNNGTGDFILPS